MICDHPIHTPPPPSRNYVFLKPIWNKQVDEISKFRTTKPNQTMKQNIPFTVVGDVWICICMKALTNKNVGTYTYSGRFYHLKQVIKNIFI